MRLILSETQTIGDEINGGSYFRMMGNIVNPVNVQVQDFDGDWITIRTYASHFVDVWTRGDDLKYRVTTASAGSKVWLG